MWYLLDENKQPYKVSLEESYVLYERPDMKLVQQDKLGPNNEIFVSTVFLGMDHGWGDTDTQNYKPVLWETMIFGGEHDDYQVRYTSHDAAIKGHQHALDLVKESLNNIKEKQD